MLDQRASRGPGEGQEQCSSGLEHTVKDPHARLPSFSDL